MLVRVAPVSAAVVVPPREIHDERLRELWAYWASKRQGARLPARRLINPLEMQPWLGNLLLMDVIDAGADFRYRLHGTNLVELFGADLTGRTVTSLKLEMVHQLLEEARRPLSTRAFVYIEQSVVAEKNFIGIAKLILPLAANGVDIDMLLVGIYPRPEHVGSSPGQSSP